MRVVIEVTAADRADIHEVSLRMDRVGGPALGSHSMRSLPAEPWVQPMGGNVPAAGEPHAGIVAGEDARAALARRLGEGKLENGDVTLLGRYLFDALIGRGGWTRILESADERNAEWLELALAWPGGAGNLHQARWEAMHSGDWFLGAHRRLPVAITRVVTDANAPEPSPVPAPARVLFVLGRELRQRKILAGAEVLGLLRDAERGEGAIDSAILEGATLDTLERKCRRFRPDIVHFVGHGRVTRAGRGQIELSGDEGQDDSWVGADELLGALGAPDRLPSVVILTGCESAAAGAQMDSLAAGLVRGGIPCAIGMAGKISDPVCRLFSRGVVAALNEGRPLVDGLTHGRRAGLQRQPNTAADELSWALPSVCMSPEVGAGFTLVDVSRSSAALSRLRERNLIHEPVFCGRRHLTQWFDELLDPDRALNVLVAYADERGRRLSEPEQLGKTRLLHEFVGSALRGGHLVVMIDDWGRDDSILPRTADSLAIQLLQEMCRVRREVGLDPPVDSVLLAQLREYHDASIDLGAIEDDAVAWARLDGFCGECEDEQLERNAEAAMGASLRSALSCDLVRLIDEARAAGDPSIDAHSRLVVAFGGIGRWGAMTGSILEMLFSSYGLGEKDEPIAVVATCALHEAEERVKDAEEKAGPLPYIRYAPLKRFDEEEDTLAYRWVLMHPRSDKAVLGDLEAYVPSPDSPDEEKILRAKLRRYIKGIPGRFEQDIFKAVVESLHNEGVLAKADDEALLAEYVEHNR